MNINNVKTEVKKLELKDAIEKIKNETYEDFNKFAEEIAENFRDLELTLAIKSIEANIKRSFINKFNQVIKLGNFIKEIKELEKEVPVLDLSFPINNKKRFMENYEAAVAYAAGKAIIEGNEVIFLRELAGKAADKLNVEIYQIENAIDILKQIEAVEPTLYKQLLKVKPSGK
jgi:hypothetical protein